MSIKKNIPNAITCANLFCGCLAIVSAFEGDLIWSAYFVGIAAVLDFLDGFVARILNVHSEIGKQLDSLADMVTFGVVPGVVMFQMIKGSILINEGMSVVEVLMGVQEQAPLPLWIPYTAFLIPIFSAIRLAKFNTDIRQSDSFIGVPTPANAIFICSFPLIMNQLAPNFLSSFLAGTEASILPIAILRNTNVLISITVLMSFLLIAPLPLFALKIKSFGWSDNKIQYIFLIISLILLILFQFIAIPFIIFLYIILSMINNAIN